MPAVHRDVPFADRRTQPLRFRVGRGPEHGAGDEHGHGCPVGHGLSAKVKGARSGGAGHIVYGAAEHGQRPDMAVHHVHVRLQSVRRRPRVHRSVYVGRGAAGGRRDGTQTVPDHGARHGHRQPDVLPAAHRERDMVVGRQLWPVSSDRLQAGVQRHRLPGPGARGPRIWWVRLRAQEQLCRLRAQQHRFDGCLQPHTACDHAVLVLFSVHDYLVAVQSRRLRVPTD